jgi:hypothetical protein
VTSLVYCHDPVPRLTPAAVQRLRVELLGVDWAAQLRSSLLEAEYTQVCMWQSFTGLYVLPHCRGWVGIKWVTMQRRALV